ncbi:DUF2784 domain-containing protein [Pseudomonas sp. GD03944]|uniref:DUF2784 domain-containing protein n=1 Tax=Pseudomonas sp. GD03944 TaxID=2975409 RepID=UPI0024482B04|nr:DUF2784 domain-containing protein [Pseudomonas sp. GD03944]MDH1262598.1 DUF2784 domain-containing protein [Pseudomonas sp. GD03944]
MLISFAADAVLLIHLLFILFAVLGGLLLLRWSWLIWLHLPAAVWGVTVEVLHLQCPLTPLENSLRHAAGEAGYEGGFIEHYLVPIIYPAGLTPQIQLWLGAFVLIVNLLVYGVIGWRAWRSRRSLRSL